MKFLISVLFLIFLYFAFAKKSYSSPFRYSIYWKQFKCEPTKAGLATDYLHNISCFAKSWNRNISTINGFIFLNKPIYPFFSGVMEYKYDTIYRNMLALPRFNVCQFYELSKTNVMLSTIFKVTNNVAPGLIHECPYYNVSQVNISLTIDDAAVMFAQGDYRVFNNISDSPNGKTLLKITTILSISSPYKESYGKK